MIPPLPFVNVQQVFSSGFVLSSSTTILRAELNAIDR